ncbi:MAG TPA: alpha-hydroxy acid oxidase [Acidimicrobiales bacterium]|nr:alpha-hydroxy acid oxidase [Acidimicrobiales bacterium]
MGLDRIFNVADARRVAKRTIPRVVFDYIDGGAEDEVTMGQNTAAFRSLSFRPRMAAMLEAPDLATTVFGTPLSMPVILAPCGLVRLMHPDGAIGASRAAADAGIVSVLSTVAGTSPEDVAEGSSGPKWFQLYKLGDLDAADQLVERAKQAGYEALVVTVDTNVLGRRERDVRHGVSIPLKVGVREAMRLGPQVLARPKWAAAYVRAQAEAKREGADRRNVPEMDRSPYTWADVEHIRANWDGPLLVKGVLTGDDARRAVQCGAEGVVVSNHGGRQLEGAPATVRVLPEVVEAVGSEAVVLLDGGVRRGGDVVKAVALGAQAVLIGRAYLYGLAVAGQAGVAHVLDILRTETARTMALMGCPSVSALDRTWIQAEPEVGKAVPS